MDFRIITGKTIGLINDALILKEAFLAASKNCRIIKTTPYQASFYEKFIAKFIKILPGFIIKRNVTFFLEFTAKRWLLRRNINIFIPNQEWYYECYNESLANIDFILCKTRHAEEIFNKIHSSVRYIGFCSLDKYNERYLHKKNYRKFLHIRGRSPYKGTLELLQLWKEHPEWPELLVISRNDLDISNFTCHNIRIIDGLISSDELNIYQNIYGIHLCPSSVEGFGHYISEALSCKSVVLTTNAPPMNELIDETCGFLADYDCKESLNLGTLYKVSRVSLERNILMILAMPITELKRMGEISRERYNLANKKFRSNVNDFLKEVTTSPLCN